MAIPQILSTIASVGAPVVGMVQSLTTAGSNMLAPFKIPEPGEMLWLLNRGYLDSNRFRIGMRLHGQDWNVTEMQEEMIKLVDGWFNHPEGAITRHTNNWNNTLYASQYTPTNDELVRMLNRGKLAPQLFRHYIKQNCGSPDAWGDWYKELGKEYPGSSDLIRFAVRESFDPATIQQYDYHKEIPIALRPYMKAQGMEWDIGTPIPAGATDNNGNAVNGQMSWLDAYWFAHWELPSITQGYDMLHRLYSSSAYGPSPDYRDGIGFVADDMSKLLKTQDIPPYWRDRLIAISYHPINVTDAKRAILLGVGADDQYYHSLRRVGYNDADAMFMLDLAHKEQERNLGIEPSKVTASWICSNYHTGILTDEAAKNLLTANGFTSDQGDRLITKCKLELDSKLARQKLADYKNMFMKGILGRVETILQLIGEGLNRAIVQKYVASWVITRDSRHKFNSAKQLLEIYSNGIISRDDLIADLQNLGYDGRQITIMVQNADYKVFKRQTAAMQRATKEANKVTKAIAVENQKQAKNAAKTAQANLKAAQKKIDNRARQIAAASTDKNVIDWFGKGLISLIDVYYRLFTKGFTKLDADLWVTKNLQGVTIGSKNLANTQAAKIYTNEGNKPIPSNPPK